MKLMRCLFALLSAVLMLSFSGCADNSGQPGVSPSENVNADTNSAVLPPESLLENSAGYRSEDILGPYALPGDVPPSRLPLSEAGATLTYWLSPPEAGAGIVLSECDTWKEIMRLTNINIEFVHPSVSGVQESFTLMVLSGELTDIVGNTENYTGGLEKAVSDGRFVNIAEWLDYAPHFEAVITSDRELTRGAYTDNGIIGHFPDIRYREKRSVVNGMVIRQDLLDKSGFKTPETFDEWEELLIYFRDHMGMPGAFFPDPTGVYTFNSAMLTGLGMTHDYVIRDRQVEFCRMLPEYRTYLEYMSRWYAENLIYQDFFNYSSYYSAYSLCFADEILIINGWTAFSGGMYAETGQAKNPEFFFSALRDPVMDKGDEPGLARRASSVVKKGTAISATTADIALAVRFMDFLYSTEGVLLTNYGTVRGENTDTEGATYYIDGTGRPILSDLVSKNPALDLSGAMHKYCMHFPPYNIFQREHDIYTEDQKKTIEVWNAYENYPTDNVQLPLTYSTTAQEGVVMSAVMGEINAHVGRMTLSFILGETPLNDETWDEYVLAIERAGIDRALDILEDAMDRYYARG